MAESSENTQKPTKHRLWIWPGVIILLIALGAGWFWRKEISRRITPPAANSSIPPACNEIGQTWQSPKSGMTLVCVPAGKFAMGADVEIQDAWDREKPAHEVNLSAFWIDQTEVTNAMFAKFIKAMGYKTWAETKRHSSYVYTTDPKIVWDDRKGAKWNAPEGPGSNLEGKESLPVVHVHRDDAIKYCKWAGGRMPTEAEWEKAARGTDGRVFPWGNDKADATRANLADKNLAEIRWADATIDDGYKFTAPVGSFPAGAGPYGALDMAGNVWELVSDWADWNYYAVSPADNPTGPVKEDKKMLPVIRGGSWYGNAWEARTFHRTMPDPNKSSVVVGFRCVIEDPRTK